MLLVHPKKNNPKRWEVAWMWIPHFLAADLSLVKHVDQRMNEAIKVSGSVDPETAHHMVLQLILEKYPIKGLMDYLDAVTGVNPEEKA